MKRPLPDSDPEVRLTALLLGELPPEEAAALRAELAADADLRALHDRLAETIGLLRENFAADTAPERLAPAKRATVLRAFRESRSAPAQGRDTVRAVSFSWRRVAAPLGLAAAVALGVGMLWLKFQEPRELFYAAAPTEKALPSRENAKQPADRMPAFADARSSGGAPANPPPAPLAADGGGGGYGGSEVKSGGGGMGGAVAPGRQAGRSPKSAAPARDRFSAGKPEPRSRKNVRGSGKPMAEGYVLDKLITEGHGLVPPPALQIVPEPAKASQRLGESRARALASQETAAEQEELASPSLDRSALASRDAPTELDLRPRQNKAGPPASATASAAGGRVTAGRSLTRSSEAADQKSNADLGLQFRRRISPPTPAQPEAAPPPTSAPAGKSALAQRGTPPATSIAPMPESLTRQNEAELAADHFFPETRKKKRLARTYGLASNAEVEGKTLKQQLAAAPPPSATPLPEVLTAANPFSTFSLNVSDVSFQLARAALDQGRLPDPARIRSEEFVNAFDYHDPEPPPGRRVGLTWERARFPFAHHREVLRLALKTAAEGRAAGRPLNLVLLLDRSGSMERADRVAIVGIALEVLGRQLRPGDRLSVVTFSRRAHLWADGVSGEAAQAALRRVTKIPPEGGTNLEEAMKLAYATAERHFLPGGVNRVVVLTDGAANLGDVSPTRLRALVEQYRRKGIAFDAFGVGWEGYNDQLLETLTRHGDGRYAFLNSREAAATGFAQKLAGALRVAAADVKVQVEFNPARVVRHRLVGFQQHRLTKEQFRDNTVDAAELGAAEAGNALYLIEPREDGEGPIGYVRARYRVPGTNRYAEREWMLDYPGPAPALRDAPAGLRLATAAAVFAERLARSPYAEGVNLAELEQLARGAAREYPNDPRPAQLVQMIQAARRLPGFTR
jgi:Mg-chelatase subunit ChlD